MNTTDQHDLTIALTPEAHELAQKFAIQQDTVEQGKKVYFNTLAVYAVRSFLDWMNIETDLNEGESWHPGVRCFHDVADLVIPNLGKLECRPISPAQTAMILPTEVIEDRIGYVAVQFQEQLNEVQLLGFVTALDPIQPPKQIPLDNLEPIETLIDYLFRLELANDFLHSNDPVAVQVQQRLTSESLSEIIAQLERVYRTYEKDEWRFAGGDMLATYASPQPGWRGAADRSSQLEWQNLAQELLAKLGEIWGEDEEELEAIASSETVTTPPIITAVTTAINEGIVSLSAWFQNAQNIFESGFQTLESFLLQQPENQAFRFATAPRSRSVETQEQQLSVSGVAEFQLTEYSLVLVVNCQVDNTETRNILARLYPTGENKYLPMGLQLIILEDSGEVFLEAQARQSDNWIQLEFTGEATEIFGIKIVLNDAIFSKKFAI